MQRKTRKSTEHYVFGQPAKFIQTCLPTNKDVYLHYVFIRNELIASGNANPSKMAVAEKVASDIEAVWKTASVPTVAHKSVSNKVQSCVSKAQLVAKTSSSKRSKTDNQVKEFDKVFDICTCRCNLLEEKMCTCPKERKVPQLEVAFLLDQRGARRMVMGAIDVQTTVKNQSSMQRKRKFEAAFEREKLRATESTVAGVACFSSDERSSDKSDSDDPAVDVAATQMGGQEMRSSLPRLAAECDRFKVSNRAGAAIVNAALKDLGFITPEDQHLLIDHSKLRRERNKSRQQACQQTSASRNEEIQALYFDGRIDWTLSKQVGLGGKRCFRKIREEHFVLLSEPNGQYLDHFTPKSGKATDIAEAIYEIYQSINGDLRAVGCDGTVCNVGKFGGVIPCIENKLQRSVHWFVCQLHGNELPLRRLFETIDGKSSGPHAFQGALGKSVSVNLTQLQIVNFKSVTGLVKDLPQCVVQDLSCDQRYLYDICLAVQTGHVSDNLASKNPGTLNHARWLTLANRILRLYVSSMDPTYILFRLVSFVVNHYAPNWFFIKAHPKCTDGPRNLFHQIQLTSRLSREDREIVEPVVQRNAFFAHPENLLLTMLTDECVNILHRAVKILTTCRKHEAAKSSKVRTFIIPSLNFQSENYVEIINWDDVRITEPPLTICMTDEIANMYIQQQLQVSNIPCHTQAVERAFKVVTESAVNCFGHESRQGWILNVMNSRKMKPSLQSKQDDKL